MCLVGRERLQVHRRLVLLFQKPFVKAKQLRQRGLPRPGLLKSGSNIFPRVILQHQHLLLWRQKNGVVSASATTPSANCLTPALTSLGFPAFSRQASAGRSSTPTAFRPQPWCTRFGYSRPAGVPRVQVAPLPPECGFLRRNTAYRTTPHPPWVGCVLPP